MNFINKQIESQIESEILTQLPHPNRQMAIQNISRILDAIYDAIPVKKRVSYGRFSTIKQLAEYLFHEINTLKISALEFGAELTTESDDFRTIGVGLGILSLYGLEDYLSVLPYFVASAAATHWEPREYAQALFRKIIKQHRQEIHPYLLELVQSSDPNLRRFVSESLRPVVENQWLYKDIDYSITILRHLFMEKVAYPRTSVGNNLSDIARRKPEVVYELVSELIAMNDKNASWIATRACRNLVKIDPNRVMDLLGVDEYRYKQRVYERRFDQ